MSKYIEKTITIHVLNDEEHEQMKYAIKVLMKTIPVDEIYGLAQFIENNPEQVRGMVSQLAEMS